MNTELFVSFANAVFPSDEVKRETLIENLKLGRFKEFEPKTMQEAVDFHVNNMKGGTPTPFPKVHCEDSQIALNSSDIQNFKMIAHIAVCEKCSTQVK